LEFRAGQGDLDAEMATAAVRDGVTLMDEHVHEALEMMVGAVDVLRLGFHLFGEILFPRQGIVREKAHCNRRGGGRSGT
jgi:hypothetical protein